MFFRPLCKKAATGYLKVSAYGAGIGGAMGGIYSLTLSSLAFADNVQRSQAHTYTGKIADGLKGGLSVTAAFVGIGACIGGAPITYPLFKLYDYRYKQLQKETAEINTSPKNKR